MFWFKKTRRKRIASRPFPDDWTDILEKNVVLYNRLTPPDQRELKQLIRIFLHEKQFIGNEGMEITDQVRLTIAANACILLLHRKTDYYPGLVSIVVNPKSFFGKQEEYLESGFIIETTDERLGEAWHRGPIVLSWQDVKNTHGAHNVVLHEFAHQIDATSGSGDSSPVLQTKKDFRSWVKILRHEYKTFLKEPKVLDEYATKSPAEFFAVATETFFMTPKELEWHKQDLYNALQALYEQDPARW